MMIQECHGGPISRQKLVNEAYREPFDWRKMFALEQLKPPGLQDIKWNELHSKWGRFTPEDKKKGLKCYNEKPPASLKKAIAEQSAAARLARAERTRGGTASVNKKASTMTKKPAPTSKRSLPKKKAPNLQATKKTKK